MKAKREMARRLLKGDGVEKDEAKAVSLLEDCAARGDADAMVMLAKCCALGQGMKHKAEHAEALVTEAAKKGNDEAQRLMRLINEWKGKRYISLSLRVSSQESERNNSCGCFFCREYLRRLHD